MEAFSLLKYWRGGGGGAAAAVAAAGLATPDTASNSDAVSTTTTTTAILTAVAENDIETDDDDNDGDDGPFFDLEFTLPDDSEDPHYNPNDNHTASDSENHSEEENDSASEDSEVDDDGESTEREIKFTLSPSSNDRSDDPNLSGSEDVFFKGKLVQLEPSSFVLNSSEPNSKPPQFTASLLKSATKFRVFMLGLKKPKPNVNVASSDKDPNGPDPVGPNPKQQPPQQKTEQPRQQQQRKLFTVKFKVEEVPIVSLFTRDNSSRGKASAASANKDESQAQTQTQTQAQAQAQTQSLSSASEEKRLMHKYLRMVKPFYVRVSRRYAEKLRFSGQLNVSASGSTAAAQKPTPSAKAVVAEKEGDDNDDASEGAGTNGKGTQKQGNLPLPAGLRVACKHLGKSRSASSASAASGPAPAGLVSSRRRDDSLLQQQDGIQGAILHCKRSFNASRECESSQLPRSVSDPLHEVSPELSRKSTNEGNDKRP